MVIERVELQINPGQEDEFEQAMAQAVKLLEGAEGSSRVTYGRGVESPSKYLLLIEWGSVDEHVTFTATDEFAQFGDQVGKFFAAKPAMEHFAPPA